MKLTAATLAAALIAGTASAMTGAGDFEDARGAALGASNIQSTSGEARDLDAGAALNERERALIGRDTVRVYVFGDERPAETGVITSF
ncbi:MAG: hypothetical protein ACLFRU_01265 [Paracoccaceae bacterium]